jgi:hypothetical protein
MNFFVKNFEMNVCFAMLDEIVDGKGDTLDRVLQIGVGDGRVVDVDGGAGARLLQDSELPHRT